MSMRLQVSSCVCVVLICPEIMDVERLKCLRLSSWLCSAVTSVCGCVWRLCVPLFFSSPGICVCVCKWYTEELKRSLSLCVSRSLADTSGFRSSCFLSPGPQQVMQKVTSRSTSWPVTLLIPATLCNERRHRPVCSFSDQTCSNQCCFRCGPDLPY